MNDLKCKIQPLMSDYRYRHTLSVVEECKRLADIFKIDPKPLVLAAYLHDITKEMSFELQLELCREQNIKLDEITILSPKTLHAFSAPALIKKMFPEYALENILSAVKYHTTGRANMTIYEKLLYLADYIEPTRKFEDCKALRTYFYTDMNDKYRRLDDTLLLSIKYTLSSLLEKGEHIHTETVNAYNFFMSFSGE